MQRAWLIRQSASESSRRGSERLVWRATPSCAGTSTMCKRPCGRGRKAPRAGHISPLHNRHIPAWQFFRKDSQLNLLRALLPLLRIGLSDRDDLRA